MTHKQTLPIWKFGVDRISDETAFFNLGKLIEYARMKHFSIDRTTLNRS